MSDRTRPPRCWSRRSLLAGLSLGLAGTGARAAEANQGQDILAKVDAVRNPGQPFRVQTTLIEYRSGKPQDQVILETLAKADPHTRRIRNMARYLAPAQDKNKLFLMDGRVMWFFDPASSATIRISPQQRLLGQASNGDVLSVNFSLDYDATLTGEETIRDADRQNVDTWKLLLTRREPGATYSQIDYWIQKASYFPIKGRFYSDSGRALKTIYYRDFKPALGGVRPSEALIVDQIDTSLVTKMTFADYQPADIPEAWFQRDYLPRLRAN